MPEVRRDWIAVACVGCIALGWFAMDSLEVSFGRLSQGTRFYELLAVLHRPVVLLLGAGDGSTWQVAGFTLLCLAALAAALAPQFAPALAGQRSGTLAGLLPLALMVLMAAALYHSGVHLEALAPPDSVRTNLLRLAQNALQRAQDVMARHVAVGPGAYLSLPASLLLALRSLARAQSMLALRAPASPPL
jgi:hypothetical protein